MKMTLFQFGTVSLHPTPDRRVIRLKTALGEQPFDIAQRERVAKIPAHGTKNQLRRRLPPLEDCRSGCVLHVLFSLLAFPAKVATHPFRWLSALGAVAGVSCRLVRFRLPFLEATVLFPACVLEPLDVLCL